MCVHVCVRVVKMMLELVKYPVCYLSLYFTILLKNFK